MSSSNPNEDTAGAEGENTRSANENREDVIDTLPRNENAQKENAAALSNDPAQEEPVTWGTIYTSSGEKSSTSIESSRSSQWSEEDEAKYLERVKTKAQAMATKLLEDAKAEADIIREQVRTEGYNQGIAEANDELEAFRSSMADSVSAVLSAIEGQCSHIFEQWRTDIIEVAKIAVEKMVSLSLSEDKKKMLEALLTESIANLDSSRVLTIHVHPDDEPVLSDIIGFTKEKYPDVSSWRVKADSGVTPGGMIVESESSLASALIESRRIAVNSVLEHLTLPNKLP